MFYMRFLKPFSDLKIFFPKNHFLARLGPFFENLTMLTDNDMLSDDMCVVSA